MKDFAKSIMVGNADKYIGNKMVKYTSKADSKKEFLYDEETGDLEVWYDGKKVDSLKKAGEGWKKYIETHATKTGNSIRSHDMKNWKYINGAQVGNADLSTISKHWSKATIDHILQNAHVFKKGVVEEAKRLKEAEKNKTGNDTMHEWATSKPKNVGNKGRINYDDDLVIVKHNGTVTYKGLEDYEPDKYAPWKYNESKGVYELPGGWTKEKVGNSKVINSDREFFKKLADDAKKEEKKYDADIEKVGNVKDKNDKDLKVGDMVNVRGKKGKITKIIGDVIEVFYDNSGTYNPDRTDRHYADEATKVGNAKVGNSAFSGNPEYYSLPGYKQELDRINSTYEKELKKEQEDRSRGKYSRTDKQVRDYWERQAKGLDAHYSAKFKNSSSDEEYWKKQYIETARKKGVPENKIQEFVKKIEKEGAKGVMSTIKNSASDDKFAYVMREFDEGKLKTPDGKVVTDPAQAKAIAYSESKKAENGLARARNAIKK